MEIILVCIVLVRILCFDLNNGEMTFKLKKVNFQGNGPADHDPNMLVIRNKATMRAGVGEQQFPFQIKFKFICSKMMGGGAGSLG